MLNKSVFNLLKFTILIAITISAFGCGKRKFFIINTPTSKTDFCQTQKNVTLNVKKIVAEDNAFFSQSDILRNYHPIEIRIDNNSNNIFILAPENISFKQASKEEMIKFLETVPSIVGATSFSIPFLAAWAFGSLIYVASLFCTSSPVIILGSAPVTIFGPPLLALAIGLPLSIHFGSKTGKKIYRKLHEDLYHSVFLDTPCEILPNLFLQKVICAYPKGFSTQFNLSLINKHDKNETLKFNVNLEK
ncbi:TPA: hypothetical protein DEO28_04580 [Candidatus Dependentiae bacterium]|nr:MAG: hypothetical protein UR14_C0002G0034 [candidate division TM6 bacterium GW2011_GWE2_31_21]KKP53831.1 MAG: hypothetical protein UR43_C0002G0034 [candidate division TM6 bacterium GW2011_GWF2_33_332]HBS47611.1 hypothetical protein [Candidatus Dependentiae bacterium]HBZ73760.1 hypothetical protein [Candidatus Dependentiae bacterium]